MYTYYMRYQWRVNTVMSFFYIVNKPKLKIHHFWNCDPWIDSMWMTLRWIIANMDTICQRLMPLNSFTVIDGDVTSGYIAFWTWNLCLPVQTYYFGAYGFLYNIGRMINRTLYILVSHTVMNKICRWNAFVVTAI